MRWNGCAVTSSTCLTNPQHNETIDVFYIKSHFHKARGARVGINVESCINLLGGKLGHIG